MGTKRYVNKAKSGVVALQAQLRRAVPKKPPAPAPPSTLRPRRKKRPPPAHPSGSGSRIPSAETRRVETFGAAVEGLVERGWFSCKEFAPRGLVDALAAEAQALWRGGRFRAAGVGRGGDWQVEPEVRGDWLCWLDPGAPTPPQREFLQLMDEFRRHLKRELCLPLWELELQYAVYQPGAHYERHIDQFREVQARVITVLLYLNAGWQPEHGGQLRIFPEAASDNAVAEILPVRHTFVCFRSELIPHEVLAPTRDRYSLGGWYRVRPEIPLPGVGPVSEMPTPPHGSP